VCRVSVEALLFAPKRVRTSSKLRSFILKSSTRSSALTSFSTRPSRSQSAEKKSDFLRLNVNGSDEREVPRIDPIELVAERTTRDDGIPLLPKAPQVHPSHIPFYTCITSSKEKVLIESGWGAMVGEPANLNVLPHSPVLLFFRATQTFLQEFHVLISTHNRTNNCTVVFSVVAVPESTLTKNRTIEKKKFSLWQKTEEEDLLFRQVVKGSSLDDNSYFNLNFNNLQLKDSNLYRLCIESPDARMGHFISVQSTVFSDSETGDFLQGIMPEIKDNYLVNYNKIELIAGKKSSLKVSPNQRPTIGLFGEEYKKSFVELSGIEAGSFLEKRPCATFAPILQLGSRESLLIQRYVLYARDEMYARSALIHAGERAEISFEIVTQQNGVSDLCLKLQSETKNTINPDSLQQRVLVEVVGESLAGRDHISDGSEVYRMSLEKKILSSQTYLLADCVHGDWLRFAFNPLSVDFGSKLLVSVLFEASNFPLIVEGYDPEAEVLSTLPIQRFYDISSFSSANGSIPERYIGESNEMGIKTVDYLVGYVARCSNGFLAQDFEWSNNGFQPRPARLLVGDKIIFDVYVSANNFTELDLQFNIFDKACKSTIELKIEEVKEDEIIILRKVKILCPDLNNGWSTLRFDPIKESANVWFKVTVESLDATPENCVAVYIQEVPNRWLVEQHQALEPIERQTLRNEAEWGPWGEAGLLTRSKKEGEKTSIATTIAKIQAQESHLVLVLSSGREDSFFCKILHGIGECGGEMRKFHKLSPQFWNYLSSASYVVVGEFPRSSEMNYLARCLAHFAVPIFEVSGSWQRENKTFYPSWGDRLLLGLADARDKVEKGCVVWDSSRPASFPHFIQKELDAFEDRRWPSFSVITVLYGKERELPDFLAAWERQKYLGKVELIFINDESPDQSTEIVEQWRSTVGAKRFEISIHHNPTNRGNCISRNRGIQNAKYDTVVITDVEWLPNSDFLAAHARQYFLHECSVVIGSHMSQNTSENSSLVVLSQVESEESVYLQKHQRQDLTTMASFLNCATGNVSFCRKALPEDFKFFDEDFSHSISNDIGFAWEDVEFGFRLYKEHLSLQWASESFALHVNPLSSVLDEEKPLHYLKSFYRLIKKHPDLVGVSRRWVGNAYKRVTQYLDENQIPSTREREKLNELLEPSQLYLIKTQPKRLKIVTHYWDAAYQYELFKQPHDFTLVSTPGVPSFINEWNYARRPLHDNVTVSSIDEVNLQDYDLVILHFDENTLAPYYTNGAVSWQAATTLKRLMNESQQPKIAVCHGSPQFYGQYEPMREQKVDAFGVETIESEKKQLINYFAHSLVITNSYQASEEWGFLNSRTIWHGFDPAEYQMTNYNRGVLTLGKNMFERPIYQGAYSFRDIVTHLAGEVPLYPPKAREPWHKIPPCSNDFARKSFSTYRADIEKYSIYLNPTIRSPMPVARTEAMLSGLVPVSIDSHDVQMFIDNGVNGFYSRESGELAEFLRYLHRDSTQTRKMGMEARAKARDVFHQDRFMYEWDKVLQEALKGG
jgi:glycosyltransferase involved in cell wall biosynthesis